jgi:branched-chain amino acid transport system substrate-binding protein
LAQKKYDTGASDTEIKIGNIMPYSGPASAYGVIGKTEEAYFRKINAEGGINGRKINFVSYDDAYSPPKTVEQARKLVESDEVLLVFNSLGTPPNTAIQKYLNTKKVPQLFVATGATKWNDPKDFPWTMGLAAQLPERIPDLRQVHPEEQPNAKIAVLYQNDDYGKDYLKGFKDGLGAKAASMIVIEESYEVSEPTIDSHIVKMKSTGADVFFNITTPSSRRRRSRRTPRSAGSRCTSSTTSRLDRQRDEAGRLREWHRTSSPRNTSRIRPTRNGRTMPA